jgi:hypothetical protein
MLNKKCGLSPKVRNHTVEAYVDASTNEFSVSIAATMIKNYSSRLKNQISISTLYGYLEDNLSRSKTVILIRSDSTVPVFV